MKKLLFRLFAGWGSQNLVMCCGFFADEVLIPAELKEQLK
ncbi:hypothetical protein DOK67_0001171 [Enterococcus sp. DIV0212c]